MSAACDIGKESFCLNTYYKWTGTDAASPRVLRLNAEVGGSLRAGKPKRQEELWKKQHLPFIF